MNKVDELNHNHPSFYMENDDIACTSLSNSNNQEIDLFNITEVTKLNRSISVYKTPILFFTEFYELTFPDKIINISLNKQLDLDSPIIINTIINHLNDYNNYIYQKKKNQFSMVPIENEFEFTIDYKSDKLKNVFSEIDKYHLKCYKETLNVYNVIRMRDLGERLIKRLTVFPMNIIMIKMNMISFLEVIGVHLSKILENEENNSHSLLTNKNVYPMLESFIDNTILNKILYNIIYQNVLGQKSLLSKFKGIYIEMVDDSSKFREYDSIDDTCTKALHPFDKLIRYTKTTYKIKNNLMIIRLHIGFISHKLEEVSKEVLSCNIFSGNYLEDTHTVTKIFSFYNRF